MNKNKLRGVHAMNAIQKSVSKVNSLSWKNIILIGLTLGGGYFLWGRYQDQLVSFLPYLILLLCPLMHIFMHRGHGGHGKHKDQGRDQE
jgi:hypothetical protein